MTQIELTPTASLTGKWKPYSAYKDSGVEWLGEIPVHWEVKRLKFFADVNMGQSPDSNDYNLNNLGVPFLQGNAEFGHIHPEPKTWCENARKFASPMDILLSVRAPVGQMNISDRTYGIGRGLCAITGQRQIDRNYFWFLLQVIREELACISTGSTYDAVSVNEVKRLVGLIPPLIEQKAIASFLDRETARINVLIAKKERLIELLQEKRDALINHAVTKGLDPTVPMKDSGVELLGEIPAHWEVLPLKRLAKIRYGLGQPPAQFDEGTPFIRATNVKSGVIVYEGMVYVDCSGIPQSRDAVLSSGEIIVVRSGAYTGDSAIVSKKFQGAIAGYDMVVAVTIGYSPFVAWQILSTEVRDLQFNFHSQRAAQPHLNAEELGDTLFKVPPSTEQHAIANYLDRETAKIDALVSRIREGIEKLKEYNTALISAAVTGKIDVGELITSPSEYREKL